MSNTTKSPIEIAAEIQQRLGVACSIVHLLGMVDPGTKTNSPEETLEHLHGWSESMDEHLQRTMEMVEDLQSRLASPSAVAQGGLDHE